MIEEQIKKKEEEEVFTSEVLKALSKCNPYNSHNSVTTALQHNTEARAASDDGARNHHLKSARYGIWNMNTNTRINRIQRCRCAFLAARLPEVVKHKTSAEQTFSVKSTAASAAHLQCKEDSCTQESEWRPGNSQLVMCQSLQQTSTFLNLFF